MQEALSRRYTAIHVIPLEDGSIAVFQNEGWELVEILAPADLAEAIPRHWRLPEPPKPRPHLSGASLLADLGL